MTVLTVLPLLQTLRDHAEDPDLLHLHDPRPTERQRTELVSTDDLQLWLITWPPGSGTGWHDHGTAGGAFTTIAGRLTERSWYADRRTRSVGVGDARSYAPGHIHDVRNHGVVPAISLHAYSPRLHTMTRYELAHGRLSPLGVELGRLQEVG